MDGDMLLAVDIGNTHITLGVFSGEKLGPRWRMATLIERTSDEFGLQMLGLFHHSGLQKDDIQAVIIASVVPTLTSGLLKCFKKYLSLDALVVDAGVKTGVSIRCDDPRQVGADRVVDAAAVLALYGYPACIVDFGTATTFDVVRDDGAYIGGLIAPGVNLSLDALYRAAARLPSIAITKPDAVVGQGTVSAMQSGIFWGYIGFIDVVAPWLTLEGLRVVWSLNK